MLKKSKRLRAEEVAQVMKTGRSMRSAHLQVKFAPAGTMLRAAAVVPKSLARKATLRNALRRALYRVLAAANTAQISGHAVFFVRGLPKEKLAATFAQELASLLPSLAATVHKTR